MMFTHSYPHQFLNIFPTFSAVDRDISMQGTFNFFFFSGRCVCAPSISWLDWQPNGYERLCFLSPVFFIVHFVMLRLWRRPRHWYSFIQKNDRYLRMKLHRCYCSSIISHKSYSSHRQGPKTLCARNGSGCVCVCRDYMLQVLSYIYYFDFCWCRPIVETWINNNNKMMHGFNASATTTATAAAILIL